MSRIQLLSERLIGKIAAGEVVERPASVLKELVENSLDAGATDVEIELGAGGKRRLRVTDDGGGMDADDALLAFDRHATSKISEFDDLERVATLGFRGEALSSIAAVAKVELTTAVAAGEGTRVRLEGGRVLSAMPVAHPGGTTVDVRSLFFNVPARRKFLKTVRTELTHCLGVVQGYALARPDVRFSVRHDGRVMLDALAGGEGAEGARRRIGQVFGETLAGSLTELGGELEPAGRVWGFVGDPSTSRGRRSFIFVNRRLIRDRAVLAVFYRAVREEWRSDEFPSLFLFLDVPPEDVDVNVHPQKAEVRFRDRRMLDGVAAILRRGLGEALGEVGAPLAHPGGLPDAALRWQGLGGRTPAPPWSGGGEVREGGSPTPGRIADAVYAPLDRPVVPLSGRDGRDRTFRLLGQYKGTLILLEGPDGLYLIDQHVAHERILYERLRHDLARETTESQSLLEPLLLELGPAETEALAGEIEALASCGFSLSQLSGGTLGLTAAPAVLSAAEAEKLLLALAVGGERSEEGEGAAGLRQRILDSLAASLACRGAVKMHDPLSADQLEALVAELFAAEQPFACPHGRPIVLKMSDLDLEQRFGRR